MPKDDLYVNPTALHAAPFALSSYRPYCTQRGIRRPLFCFHSNSPFSVLPIPPVTSPPHDIDQAEQYRHLDQRPDGRCQRLIAIGPKLGHGHGDRQLKVVTRSREALRRGECVAHAHAVRHVQRQAEDDHKT